MNWVAKIIAGKPDEYVHSRLMKYGIGEHEGPRIKLRLTKSKISFYADQDQEMPVLGVYTQHAPEGTHKISGKIHTYDDRSDEFSQISMPLSWKKSKKKGGAVVFNAKLKEVAPLEDISELLEMDGPTTYFFVSLSPSAKAKPWKITTKTSFQKPPKDVEEEDEKNPNFCKGALANTPEVIDALVEGYLPDFKDKVSAEIKNIYVHQKIIIEDIEIPDDDSLSFTEKRKLAKKRGKLVRIATIDKEDFTEEYSFLA